MIDTHCHLWAIERGDYHWLKPSNPILYRDFLPEHVQPAWINNEISGVIAVQAAPTVAETEYLLELAESHDSIIGVVGTLDLTSRDTPGVYQRLRQSPYFVGIRYSLSGSDTDQWEISDVVLDNLAMMAKDGFPIDLLMKPHNVPYIMRLLEEVPQLITVANHLGSPPYKESYQPWADQMAELAKHPLAMCKLSGMITQVGGYHPELLRRHVQHLVECFGIDRLLFGSDWPVALMAGSYDEVVRLFYDVLPVSLHETELRKMEYENAVRCYGVQRRDKGQTL